MTPLIALIIATGAVAAPPNQATYGDKLMEVEFNTPPTTPEQMSYGDQLMPLTEAKPVVKPLDLTLRAPPPTLWTKYTKWSNWQPPSKLEVSLLAITHVAIALDVMATLRFRAQGVRESNWILGPTPSDAKVLLVGGLAPIVAMTALWYVLPPHWRNLVPGAVLLPEIMALQTQMHYGYL